MKKGSNNSETFSFLHFIIALLFSLRNTIQNALFVINIAADRSRNAG